MKIKTAILKLCFFLSFFSPIPSFSYVGTQIGLPTFSDYQEFESPHFIVIFPNANESEAIRATAYLEQAHQKLTPFFDYKPKNKTKVIIVDNQDSANGLASTIGEQGLVLYLTAPDPYSALGENEDWLKTLIIHEYTHYLTLEQRRGFYVLLKYLFGDLFYANNAWPTWLTEGVAVYSESKFTFAGRGDGTYFNTLTRDHFFRISKDVFKPLADLSGTVPDYPFGETQYYLGYGIWSELQHQYGLSGAKDFSTESSARFPYFNNGTLENVRDTRNNVSIDSSFSDLFSSWRKREYARFLPQLDWMEKNKINEPSFFTPSGGVAMGAHYSPSGEWIAMTYRSGHKLSSIEIISAKDKRRVHSLERTVASPGLSFSKDSKKLYFTAFDYRRRYQFFADVYEYDLSSRTTKRLTTEARAKDVDVCSDQFLVFTSQEGKTSSLKTFDFRTKKIESIWRAPDYDHIAVPRCHGNTVYFSLKAPHDLDAIYKIDLHGNAPTHLAGGLEFGFGALFPEPANNGFYFTLVEDDFYKLAFLDEATRKLSVQAVGPGGYWFADQNPINSKEVLVTHLGADGIRVGVLPPLPISTKTRVPRLEAEKKFLTSEKASQEQTEIRNRENKLKNEFQSKKRSYSLLRSLAPRIWSPYLAFEDDRSIYGFLITGWDDLDIFSYELTAYYDSVPKQPSGQGVLRTRLGRSDFLFYFDRSITDYLTFRNGTRIYDMETLFGVSLGFPLLWPYSFFYPSLAFETAQTNRNGDFGSRDFEREYRAGGSLRFDSRQNTAYSVFLDSGFMLTGQTRHFFGSGLNAWKSLGEAEYLFPLGPRHSVLDAKITGAHATGGNAFFPASILKVGGRGKSSDLNPALKGYPSGHFESDYAYIGELEYQLPLFQIFKGLGPLPVFFDNVGVTAFYNAARFSPIVMSGKSVIDSVGGALVVNTTLGYQFPLHLKLEFAHGLKQELQGENTFYLGLDF